MSRTIHPSTLVVQCELAVFAIMITVIAYYVRDLAANLFVPTLEIVWGLTILSGIFLFIKERFVSLEIGDHDLVYKKGILFTRTVLVPYEKVTDARYSQGLLERIFGLGTLDVDTAGTSDIAIKMPGVHRKDMEEILGNVRHKPGRGEL